MDMDIHKTEVYRKANRPERRLMWLQYCIDQAARRVSICDTGVGNGSNFQYELDDSSKALAKAKRDYAEYATWLLKKGRK